MNLIKEISAYLTMTAVLAIIYWKRDCFQKHHVSFCSVNGLNLPPGIHYNHEEFVDFMVMTPAELIEKRSTELKRLQPLNDELKSLVRVSAYIECYFHKHSSSIYLYLLEIWFGNR